MDLDGPADPPDASSSACGIFVGRAGAGIPMVAQGVVVDEAPEGGFYQGPTLLRDVPVGHRLAQEEVFGPVLSAMAFQDEDHAVELANATQFGLVAGIWTRDGARQFRMGGACTAARCSSTTMARAVVWSCRLAASNPAATGARRGLRRCTASPP